MNIPFASVGRGAVPAGTQVVPVERQPVAAGRQAVTADKRVVFAGILVVPAGIRPAAGTQVVSAIVPTVDTQDLTQEQEEQEQERERGREMWAQEKLQKMKKLVGRLIDATTTYHDNYVEIYL
jgi:hypothetical protein